MELIWKFCNWEVIFVNKIIVYGEPFKKNVLLPSHGFCLSVPSKAETGVWIQRHGCSWKRHECWEKHLSAEKSVYSQVGYMHCVPAWPQNWRVKLPRFLWRTAVLSISLSQTLSLLFSIQILCFLFCTARSCQLNTWEFTSPLYKHF